MHPAIPKRLTSATFSPVLPTRPARTDSEHRPVCWKTSRASGQTENSHGGDDGGELVTRVLGLAAPTAPLSLLLGACRLSRSLRLDVPAPCRALALPVAAPETKAAPGVVGTAPGGRRRMNSGIGRDHPYTSIFADANRKPAAGSPRRGLFERFTLRALRYTVTQQNARFRRLARQGARRSPLRVGRFTLQWRRACTRYHGEPSIHRKGTAQARSPRLGGRLDHLP